MNAMTGPTATSGPCPGSDPLADLVAGRVLGLELAMIVAAIPSADLLRAARELGVLPGDGTETDEQRAGLVRDARAALHRQADRLSAQIMCLKPCTECCALQEGNRHGA